jgi:tetratricopeptide (TPR) repeat protein
LLLGGRLRRYVVLGAAVLVAVATPILLRPTLACVYHLEAGGRALEAARAFVQANPKAANPDLDRALRHLQRAVELAPGDGFAHRRLGQAFLLLGDNERALEALSQAAALRPHFPLIDIEMGYAYDGLGRVERALAAYERGRYGPATEAAIVNYIKLADWKTAAGGGDEALGILDKALKLDPNCLPVLVRKLQIYQGMSEQAAREFGEPLRARLAALTADQVAMPSEPRLAAYTREAMETLVKEGVWK